jgi:Fe2+ transport system protein FeoA
MADCAASLDRRNTPSATAVPLLDLAPGTVAVLRTVLDQQSRAVLRSLGLTDGARLRICRIGDTCIIQVRSTRIGLSRVVAQSIYVAVAEGGVW